MAEEHCKLGRIYWSETFPFVRLFSTFKRAVSFRPLLLAFCCVLLCYISGRVLDALWKAADGGVLVAPEATARGRPAGYERLWPAASASDEILAYVLTDRQGFEDWRKRAAQRWEEAEAAGEEADTSEHEQARDDLLALIDGRLARGLEQIDNRLEELQANAELSEEDKQRERAAQEQAREALPGHADSLRLTLTGHEAVRLAESRQQSRALFDAAGGEPDERATAEQWLADFLPVQQQITEMKRLRPGGPFISLLDYEMRCFAAAIQGVCSGRWGFSGSALGNEPAMLGSIASAASGIQWLVTQRPCFTVFFALALLVTFAFFGGAICRVAAVSSARDESISFRDALGFSGEKFAALVAAPLLPAGIFVIAGLLMFVGGLVAAIPWLETVVALSYGLTLLGGVVLAGALLAVVLGFHLMWPTIAVEASDAFDAVSRAASYVFQRAWHVAFYSFVLLLYGGASFVIVRLIGMLVLKLSHVATGAGMNLAGSAHTDTFDKLDAIWRMPAWQDLPLLPALGAVSFWGDFGSAPLSGTESFALFFFALWVFIVVGLVGAFVVSFYFCGSTEMYFLLRREYDGVDYDEIYYEEPEDEFEEDDAEEADEAAGAGELEQPEQSVGEGAEQPGTDPPPAE